MRPHVGQIVLYRLPDGRQRPAVVCEVRAHVMFLYEDRDAPEHWEIDLQVFGQGGGAQCFGVRYHSRNVASWSFLPRRPKKSVRAIVREELAARLLGYPTVRAGREARSTAEIGAEFSKRAAEASIRGMCGHRNISALIERADAMLSFQQRIFCEVRRRADASMTQEDWRKLEAAFDALRAAVTEAAR